MNPPLEKIWILDLTSHVLDEEAEGGPQEEVVLLVSRPAYSQVAAILAFVTYGFTIFIGTNYTFPLPVVERGKEGRSGDFGLVPQLLTGCSRFIYGHTH